MKAILLTRYKSPDFFELKNIDKPSPKDNEVLIKVHAVSINSWDWEIMMATPFVNRLMVGLLKPTRIKILGCDIAGRIESVGKNIKQFQPGDEVFGDLSSCGWGGFAEYVCAPEKALALKPVNLTFEQAAAVPQAGLLALQGLYKGKIKSAQKVLINGAGGGVGSFAIQIAKLYGAEVTGVDSTVKQDMMSSMGADHVIDYTQEDFTRNGQHYDLILDVQAHHSFFDYKRALSPEGIFVMVGGASTLANKVLLLGSLISMFSRQKMGLLLYKANKDMASMNEFLETGKVIPVVDRCYPLSEVDEAFRYFGQGLVKGKIVVTLEDKNKP